MTVSRWKAILCVCSIFLMAGLAVAQETSSQDSGQPGAAEETAQQAASQRAIEEITVTARKTEERLEDVPLTMSAFTSDNMAELGLMSVENVVSATPGLHIANYQGIRDDPGLRFRGMAVGTSSRFRQNASAFLDGVYLPGSSQSVTLADVERTEVVKGPQSAFFGRSTFGGAINFITKSPTFDWTGSFNGTFGDDGRVDIDGGVSGPISDAVAFRVFARSFDYDGGYDNGYPGGMTLGGQSTVAFNPSLTLEASESARVKLRLAFSKDDDGASAVGFFPSSVLNCGPFGGTSQYFCGTLEPELTNPIGYNTSVDTTAADGANWPKSDYGLEREFQLAALDIDVMLTENLNLTSLTSYLTEEVENMDEFTGTSTLLWYYKNKDTLLSQELRLSGGTDNSDWMAGFYYLDAKYVDQGNGFGCGSVDWRVFGYIPGCTFFGWPQVRGYFDITASPERKITNVAFFGSYTYHVNDRLSFSLEGRYAKEELDFGEVVMDGTDGQTRAMKDDFTSFMPRLIIDYKASDDSTLYLNIAQGNKPGSFNTDMATMHPDSLAAFEAKYGVELAIPEEEVLNYEIGWKTIFGRGRHSFTAAAYYMDWTNQGFRNFAQGEDTNGDGIYDPAEDEFQIDYDATAGKSKIKGVEMFYSGRLGEYFDLMATYNYNDAYYVVFEDSNMEAVYGDPDASGQTQPLSPEHKASLGLGFTIPAFSDWDFFARADGYFSGSSYTWIINLAETGDSTRINLRTGVRNDNWDLSVFVNNVTDDDTFIAIRRFTDFETLGQAFWAGLPLPKEFGATLRYRF